MASFAAQVAKWTDKAEYRANEVPRRATKLLGLQVINGTPVATSRAMSSWRTTLGQPEPMSRILYDHGRTAREDLADTIKEAKGDWTLKIYTQIVYMWPLERGHSQQQPNGWLRLAAQNWDLYVRSAVRSVR